MAEGNAIVKAVVSGDTVILQGRSTGGPPPERQLSLSSLLAPRVARGPGAQEEPWGWASREFLRKLCVGFPVTFKVDYTVPTLNNREFGTIILNGESLNKTVVKEGWARVRTPRQGNEGEASPDLEELQRLEAEAIAEKKGVHAGETGEGATREGVQWGPEVDSQAVLQRIKGKTTKMTIEYVRDGAAFRAIIPDTHTYINLSLAGIAAPRVNTQTKTASAAGEGGAAAAPKPEAHALESKYFTETRLLHRDVDVVVGGVDKYGTLYGTILHPKGNISVELLKAGLARVVDYSIDFTARENALQYRLAERQAKAGQVRIWKGYTPPTITGSKEFAATVIEIVSGDMVVVKVEGGKEDGAERKLSLASLRAPRGGNVKRGEAGEPWAAEAKEHLRQKLIGRSVVVVVDYEREIPVGERKEKRAYASLFVGKGTKKKSVSEMLVGEGLATVMRHRDEERAENYDDLLVAETTAKAGKKGMYSGGAAPPPPRVTDLSLDAKKARSYLPHLQRETDVRAVVEYVFSGSRFKLFIPSENCSVMMALTSLRTPNPSRGGTAPGDKSGRAGDPFGEEAKTFTRQHLLQRTVEVSFGDMDKNGVALGNISVLGGSGERTPFGLELVKLGLARVDERGTTSLPVPFVHSLHQAQAAAVAAKRGVWSVEVAEAEKEEEEVTAAQSDELVDVSVSEICDGVHFFYQQASNTEALAKVTDKMKALTAAEGTSGGSSKLAFEPRKGNVVAALFNDGSGPLWYRARVEEKLPAGGGFKVLFLDYGNKAVVKLDQIRTIDGGFTSIPPQAKEAGLAFLRAPGLGEEWGEESAVAFSRLAYGKVLRARVFGQEGGKLLVSLQEGGEGAVQASKAKTLNQSMVEEGLARVSKRADRTVKKLGVPAAVALVEEMKEAQEGARRGRVGMWKYGDVADSDDEEGF